MKLTVTWLDDDKGLVAASVDGRDPLPCGTVFWAGDEWLYQADGDPTTQAINVDPEQTEQFREERLSIARLDQSVRPALEAEWEGRIRLYRDDSRALAEIGARVEAKRWLKAHDVPEGCTGYVEDGEFVHDGDSCPIHEA